MTGLPGGIDYLLLTLVKLGYMNKSVAACCVPASISLMLLDLPGVP